MDAVKLSSVCAQYGVSDAANGMAVLLEKLGKISPQEREKVVYMSIGAASALEAAKGT